MSSIVLIRKRLLVSWFVAVLFCLIPHLGLAQGGGGSALALTANPASATTNAGVPVTFTITVTPAAGFSDNVQFSCTSNIPASACSFNPKMVTPNGAPANTTMTVATNFFSAGGATFGGLAPSRSPLRSNQSLYATLSLGGAGIFGLVLSVRRGQNHGRRWLRLALAGLALLIVLIAFEGCGGIKARTPSGNYAVVVTGSSVNSVPVQSATTNVTLVVN